MGKHQQFLDRLFSNKKKFRRRRVLPSGDRRRLVKTPRGPPRPLPMISSGVEQVAVQRPTTGRILLLLQLACALAPAAGGLQRGQPIQCGSQLNSLHGKIHSPNFPEPYPNNLQCQWNITVPTGYRIVLRFAQFDVESMLDCTYDYVIVSHTNSTLGRFCGKLSEGNNTKHRLQNGLNTAPKGPIISNSNELSIILHSDYSNEEDFHGFEAHYAATDVNECDVHNGGCMHFCHNFIGGHVCSCQIGYVLAKDNSMCIVQCQALFYTKETGAVMSPEFPQNYPPLADCDWTITAEAGYIIYLMFNKFSIEDHPDYICPYDWVRLEDTANLSGPLCGSRPPPTWQSASNWMRITFRSDKSINNIGFKASYEIKGVPCVDISAPADGYLHSNRTAKPYRFKDVVSYSCRRGFKLVGSQTRTCTEIRVWTGQEPSCQKVSCQAPLPVKSGQMHGSLFDYGSRVNFTCDPSYDIVGDTSLVCLSNGSWSGESPTCQQSCGWTAIGQTTSHCRLQGDTQQGHPSLRGSLPWAVSLQVTRKQTPTIHCGATMVNQRWLLTAAHCVDGVGPDDINVFLGHINTTVHDRFTSTPRVSRIVLHDGFDRLSFEKDVALVELKKAVSFNQFVQPICLRFNKSRQLQITKEMFRLTTGWVGKVDGASRDAAKPQALHQRCVMLSSKGKCQEHYSRCNRKISKSMQCSRVEQGSNSPSNPGSGLYHYDHTTRRWFVTGIASRGGSSCGTQGSYDVYTKLNHRLADWVGRKTTTITTA